MLPGIQRTRQAICTGAPAVIKIGGLVWFMGVLADIFWGLGWTLIPIPDEVVRFLNET